MVLSLSEIINEENFNEAALVAAFKKFKCTKDKDVESFLIERALKYERNSKARTYLVINELTGDIDAYFSIALNVFEYDDATTKTCKTETAFGSSKRGSAYLIGQIGKSDTFSKKSFLANILDVIYEKIDNARVVVGGRVVYLECKQIDKVKNLYINQGFFEGNCPNGSNDLLQMYKVLD